MGIKYLICHLITFGFHRDEFLHEENGISHYRCCWCGRESRWMRLLSSKDLAELRTSCQKVSENK